MYVLTLMNIWLGTKALSSEIKKIKHITFFTIANLARSISLPLRISALVLIEMLFSVKRYIFKCDFSQNVLTGMRAFHHSACIVRCIFLFLRDSAMVPFLTEWNLHNGLGVITFNHSYKRQGSPLTIGVVRIRRFCHSDFFRCLVRTE